MIGQINTGRRLAFGSLRLSPWSRDVTIKRECPTVDVSTDESVGGADGLIKALEAGLPEATCEMSSLLSDYELERLGQLGGAATLLSYAVGGTPGRLAYLAPARFHSDDQKAKTGDAYGVTSMLRFTELTVRGSLLVCQPLEVSGVSTALEIGPIAENEELVVGLHVTSPPGVSGTDPELVVQVQSATSLAFSGTVVDRGAPQTFSAPGWSYFSITGDVTDVAWRLNFNITGVDPLFYLMACAGRRVKE